MINKDGKLFGKISVIDILVIIVIIAMAFGVYMRFFKTPEAVQVKTEKFTYTVCVEKVREFSVDALKNKGAVYDTETKEYLGEIKEIVSVEPTMDTGVNYGGKTVEIKYPERYNVIMEIETDGNVGANGYYTASNKLITVGGELEITTKYIETTGDVISISN